MTMPAGLLDPSMLEDYVRQQAESQHPTMPRPTQPGQGALGAPTRRPGLLDRLMPVPGAMEGLLSPEDIKQARMQGLLGLGTSLLSASGPRPQGQVPSLGQALGQGVQQGMSAYQQALQGTAGMNVAVQERQKAQQIQQQRAAIQARYPARPNETPQQVIERLQRMLPEFIAINDTEMVGKLVELLKSVGNDTQRKPPMPQEIRLGNEVLLRNPETGEEIKRYPIGPSPRDPNAPDTAQQLRDQRVFRLEEQLTDNFNRDTKTQRETVSKLEGAISERGAALSGDPAAQINILYAFINSMDPASAVREGEIALARAATPVWSQAQAIFQKYLTDGSVTLTPAMIRSMTDLMGRRSGSLANYVGERRSYYLDLARRRNLSNPEELFPEPKSTRPSAALTTGNPLLP
jgi:hypothetical protein